MATWTDVSSTVLEPGDPIRSVDIIAIKENIIALSEGASGAPKIAAVALNTTTNERDWVLARTAELSVGSVGSYAILGSINTTAVSVGNTKAGSNLRYMGLISTTSFTNTAIVGGGVVGSGDIPAGTWRCMGRDASVAGDPSFYGASLWLRIS